MERSEHKPLCELTPPLAFCKNAAGKVRTDNLCSLSLHEFGLHLIFFVLACLTIRQEMVIKMITVVIAKNEEKAKEILTQMLDKIGNANINIIKEADIIKITEKENLKDLVSLKDKIIELEDSLYDEKKGVLYKSVLETMEKPLIEHILERTEGNQLKAARILGINRNTLRAKIKKLSIDLRRWKNA